MAENKDYTDLEKSTELQASKGGCNFPKCEETNTSFICETSNKITFWRCKTEIMWEGCGKKYCEKHVEHEKSFSRCIHPDCEQEYYTAKRTLTCKRNQCMMMVMGIGGILIFAIFALVFALSGEKEDQTK